MAKKTTAQQKQTTTFDTKSVKLFNVINTSVVECCEKISNLGDDISKKITDIVIILEENFSKIVMTLAMSSGISPEYLNSIYMNRINNNKDIVELNVELTSKSIGEEYTKFLLILDGVSENGFSEAYKNVVNGVIPIIHSVKFKLVTTTDNTITDTTTDNTTTDNTITDTTTDNTITDTTTDTTTDNTTTDTTTDNTITDTTTDNTTTDNTTTDTTTDNTTTDNTITDTTTDNTTTDNLVKIGIKIIKNILVYLDENVNYINVPSMEKFVGMNINDIELFLTKLCSSSSNKKINNGYITKNNNPLLYEFLYDNVWIIKE